MLSEACDNRATGAGGLKLLARSDADVTAHGWAVVSCAFGIGNEWGVRLLGVSDTGTTRYQCGNGDNDQW